MAQIAVEQHLTRLGEEAGTPAKIRAPQSAQPERQLQKPFGTPCASRGSPSRFVTYLLMGGYGIWTVQELLGGKNTKTTMIYATS